LGDCFPPKSPVGDFSQVHDSEEDAKQQDHLTVAGKGKSQVYELSPVSSDMLPAWSPPSHSPPCLSENPEESECSDDSWGPETLERYAVVLTAVGRLLEQSLSEREEVTEWCVTRPSPLPTYVKGLIYTEASHEAFIIAVIFLIRFLEAKPITLTKYNAQLLYLTALVVAIKWTDDDYFNSSYYAKVGGLKNVQILNDLEMDFCFTIAFNLFVSDDRFKTVEAQLLQVKE